MFFCFTALLSVLFFYLFPTTFFYSFLFQKVRLCLWYGRIFCFLLKKSCNNDIIIKNTDKSDIMNKQKITDFFDSRAPYWDEEMIKDDNVIAAILRRSGLCPGASVLDVACGTGVMIPYFLSRGAASVTGIDISPEMVRIASSKFASDNVSILCADAEEYTSPRRFDIIMIYNAFPHFIDRTGVLKNLSGLLADGGTLTVAHGMSRENIARCHEGTAAEISLPLPPAKELALLLPEFKIVSIEDNEKMYLVTWKKAT